MTRGPSQTKHPASTRRGAVAQQRAQPLHVGVMCAERGRQRHVRCVRDPHDVWVSDASASRAFQGLAGGVDERAEGRGLAHREVGEDLAVDLDLRGLQPRNDRE